MVQRRYWAAAAFVAVAGACGGSGGGGGAGSGLTEASYGVVRLLDHSPADGAVQVAAQSQVLLEFDAPMAIDSFGDADTWLRAAGSTQNVAGTFSRGTGGRVVFAPAAQLQLETDYRFQLSALTCDGSGRILDVTRSFGFRTFDATPPQIAALDVADDSVDQSRTRTFTITFSEGIKDSSVTDSSFYLRDVFGIRYKAERTVDGAAVTLDPYADLPGDRQFFLVATGGVTDRAGNALAATSTTRFRTEQDTVPPRVIASWPASGSAGVTPVVQPTFTFDESMDPATVEPASLLFQDEFGSVVPFAIEYGLDQRTLRVRPTVKLKSGREYTLAFLLGPAAATDTSGNVLEATQGLAFTTGSDFLPPGIASSMPAAGESRVPGTVTARLSFSEPLDTGWIDDKTVTATVDGEEWAVVVAIDAPDTIRVTPVPELPIDCLCTVSLRGGHDGVRDVAGNVLAQDLTLWFTTSSDAGSPHVMQLPPDGANAVATSSHATFVFDARMDPQTLGAATVQVLDDLGNPLPGALVVSGGDRVVTFTPATPFEPLTYYRTRVVGGSGGARRASGNWFESDQNVRFRTGASPDSIAPTITATVNGIHPSRATGLVLPPSGFTIDVSAADEDNQRVDMGTVEVLLQGGQGPGAAMLLPIGSIGYGTFSVVVPADMSLSPGEWTMQVTARDLSGNLGASSPLPFSVALPETRMQPFERTQVVWVRTDLSRDNNTRPDFDDDLLRLGLATEGDPIGTNSRLRDLLLDGILAQASRLYGRGDRGEPIDGGSVGIRFTKREPIALPHTQMSLGGLDPGGSRDRVYGDESTGVLGRAYYDFCNGNPSERNTSSDPGLGVFPAEMWLHQTHLHLQVWPSFQTTFAQRFRPLSPDMGGVPAGAHPLDAQVLAPDFDYDAADGSARARWTTIMEAADQWATVIGIVLAHEVGHSVGLVAPGPSPSGLFGDSSLHDTFASAVEVMAASIGYEAMATLGYAFRDIDLAYLRQRILLR